MHQTHLDVGLESLGLLLGLLGGSLLLGDANGLGSLGLGCLGGSLGGSASGVGPGPGRDNLELARLWVAGLGAGPGHCGTW